MDNYIENFFKNLALEHEVKKNYTISKEMYSIYLDLFKDFSSIHTNKEYAIQRGFKDIVIHGSIINGLISNFTGTIFPGDRSFTQSTELQFKSPIYVEDVLEFICKVSQIVESVGVLILEFQINNLTQNKLSAEARIQTGIL